MWKQGTRQPWTTGFIGKDPSRKKFFDCLYCEGQKAVKVEVRKKSGTAHLHCRTCKVSWDCTIHYLEEECDVFDRWRNACREAAIREVDLDEQHIKEKPKADTTTAPTSETVSKTKKILTAKRLDLNKLANNKPKTAFRSMQNNPVQVKGGEKPFQTTGKKRHMLADKQAASEDRPIKKVKIEAKTVRIDHIQHQRDNLAYSMSASENGDSDNDLEKELALALAAEAERERMLKDKRAGKEARAGADSGVAIARAERDGLNCGLAEQQNIEQQKQNPVEMSVIEVGHLPRVSKSRANSYDSLFGTLSDDSESKLNHQGEFKAEPDSVQRMFEIETDGLTQSINDNFAALHVAFGLEENEKNVEVTTPDFRLLEEKDARSNNGRKSSIFPDSLFGHCGWT